MPIHLFLKVITDYPTVYALFHFVMVIIFISIDSYDSFTHNLQRYFFLTQSTAQMPVIQRMVWI